MKSSKHRSRGPSERDRALIENLSSLFRRSGWRVIRQRDEQLRPDLVVEGKRQRFIVQAKAAVEGRRDRLIPLLSQAILQAQSLARRGRAHRFRPLAIVSAPKLAPALVDDLMAYANDVAPGVPVGVLDHEGRRRFSVPELLEFGAEPSGSVAARAPRAASAPRLFSDLNQWMLKLLLAPQVPEGLLGAPRAQYRNASELAKAAGVSVMSAFRFVSRLRSELFLAEPAAPLRLIRVEELLRRWAAANHGPWRELPMRWIAGEGEQALDDAVRRYVGRESEGGKGKAKRQLPRICLGLFSAARVLNLAVVHGAPQHLYVEKIDSEAIQLLGLRSAHERVDVYLRVPRAPESVFRASVLQNGLVVADALQIWLDLLEHPARGAAQAEAIKKHALADVFHSGRPA